MLVLLLGALAADYEELRLSRSNWDALTLVEDEDLSITPSVQMDSVVYSSTQSSLRMGNLCVGGEQKSIITKPSFDFDGGPPNLLSSLSETDPTKSGATFSKFMGTKLHTDSFNTVLELDGAPRLQNAGEDDSVGNDGYNIGRRARVALTVSHDSGFVAGQGSLSASEECAVRMANSQMTTSSEGASLQSNLMPSLGEFECNPNHFDSRGFDRTNRTKEIVSQTAISSSSPSSRSTNSLSPSLQDGFPETSIRLTSSTTVTSTNCLGESLDKQLLPSASGWSSVDPSVMVSCSKKDSLTLPSSHRVSFIDVLEDEASELRVQQALTTMQAGSNEGHRLHEALGNTCQIRRNGPTCGYSVCRYRLRRFTTGNGEANDSFTSERQSTGSGVI
ncbi:unnamed protein product [Protopolystoma xenopodis]|uniref:Uncharacterized protein n=1 Tax=Protopolystoma xenopodis TaxID=117903 RepID=A0A3S5BKI3_9PLAT|nr:unnamed protein product [Protopolystoma xenopodis]